MFLEKTKHQLSLEELQAAFDSFSRLDNTSGGRYAHLLNRIDNLLEQIHCDLYGLNDGNET